MMENGEMGKWSDGVMEGGEAEPEPSTPILQYSITPKNYGGYHAGDNESGAHLRL